MDSYGPVNHLSWVEPLHMRLRAVGPPSRTPFLRTQASISSLLFRVEDLWYYRFRVLDDRCYPEIPGRR